MTLKKRGASRSIHESHSPQVQLVLQSPYLSALLWKPSDLLDTSSGRRSCSQAIASLVRRRTSQCARSTLFLSGSSTSLSSACGTAPWKSRQTILSSSRVPMARAFWKPLRLHAAQVSHPSHRGGDDTLQCPVSNAALQKPGGTRGLGPRGGAAASGGQSWLTSTLAAACGPMVPQRWSTYPGLPGGGVQPQADRFEAALGVHQRGLAVDEGELDHVSEQGDAAAHNKSPGLSTAQKDFASINCGG